MLLISISVLILSACNRAWMRPPPGGYPLATPQNLPFGVQAQPTNLGTYRTCNAYAQQVRALGGQQQFGQAGQQQFGQAGQQQFGQAGQQQFGQAGQQQFGQGQWQNQQQQGNWLQLSQKVGVFNFTLSDIKENRFVLNQVPPAGVPIGQQQFGQAGQQQPFGANLQAGLNNTVMCINSHTCLCANNQYYGDVMPNGTTLYRCVELSTARIENPNVYSLNPNMPGGGVIKFALPAIFCNQR